jgi:nucleoside-diphosphate-sugar epimerase
MGKRQSAVENMVNETDLEHVLDHTRDLWDELRGERLFITGGTGFIGSWLMDTFAYADDRLNLNASALVLSRVRRANKPGIAYHFGDVRTFEFPEGRFPFVIHGAAESSRDTYKDDQFDVITKGTGRVLDFAEQAAAEKMLFLSSGAIYLHDSPYADGKRAGEVLCGQATFPVTIVRLYCFVGPYQPLNSHFAIGNFIRDGLAGGPIRVQGDGTPHRSYLYAADLAIWLWTLLFRGGYGAYNVGSDEDVTVEELAHRVAKSFNPVPRVVIAKRSEPGRVAERYVPILTEKAADLGLRQWVGLDDAIERTVRWHGGCDGR